MSERSTHPFWRFFIDHYRVTYLLILAVVIFGVFAIIQMPKESQPEVDIPVAVVTTSLPGAGAQNVEELVTNPLEDQISGLSEITDLTSTSEQGFSSIQIQFESDVDRSEMLADIRSRVERAAGELPDDASDPTVQEVSFSDVPIVTMALAGDREPAALKPYATDLQDELENISGVSRVTVTGAPDRTIEVTLQPGALNQFDLSARDVMSALESANVDLPAGAIETDGAVYTVRVNAELADASDVRDVGVTTRGGSVITVGDVANVRDTYTDQGRISRFASDGSPARSTVSLQIFKESGEGNILTISDEARRIAQEMEGDSLPSDVGVDVVRTDADTIRSDLQTLMTSGTITMGIILLVLAAFLGWREALLASLVVPVSFLMAFIAIYLFGLTVNFLTLFSLILSLGILVDAAIVVTESIFIQRSHGATGVQAAIATIDDFQAPLVAGTMTTVFVFLPMLLTSGTIGEFIVSIPITVSSVLIAALFVALGIVTTFATRFLKAAHTSEKAGLFGLGVMLSRLYAWYTRTLTRVIARKKAVYTFLAGIAALFCISIALPFIGIVAINMFPAPNADTINLDLEAPAGTPLGETSEMMRRVERVVQRDPRVASFLTTIGQGSQAGSIDIASVANANIGSMSISLADEREDPSSAVVADLQNELRDFDGAEVDVQGPGGGPQQGAPVQVRLTGEDLTALERIAVSFADELRHIDGATNVDSGVNATAGELTVRIDRDVAHRYGVTARQIASVLRTGVSGSTATDIKTLEEDINIVVQSALGTEDSETAGPTKQVAISDLRSMPVQTTRGTVSLDTFADIELSPGRSAIDHRDGERVITVSAQTASGATVPAIVSAFQERIEGTAVPPGVTVSYGGESQDIQESFTDLAYAMLLGVLAIFTLMVWQFRSYRQPLFIMVTIPLALTGVFFGLAVVQQPFSFPGFIGVVALAGVVVNNAIILIDAINNERIKRGKSKMQAVIDGAGSRLQPVILTTLTTVTGLLPLAFSSPTWAPVAYSISFGLLFSTVLTLFVVPMLYAQFARRDQG